MFIDFFFLCPLSLTIKLNFNHYIASGLLAPEIHMKVFWEAGNLPLPWCHMDIRISKCKWLTNCTWILISNPVMQTKKSITKNIRQQLKTLSYHVALHFSDTCPGLALDHTGTFLILPRLYRVQTLGHI